MAIKHVNRLNLAKFIARARLRAEESSDRMLRPLHRKRSRETRQILAEELNKVQQRFPFVKGVVLYGGAYYRHWKKTKDIDVLMVVDKGETETFNSSAQHQEFLNGIPTERWHSEAWYSPPARASEGLNRAVKKRIGKYVGSEVPGEKLFKGYIEYDAENPETMKQSIINQYERFRAVRDGERQRNIRTTKRFHIEPDALILAGKNHELEIQYRQAVREQHRKEARI